MRRHGELRDELSSLRSRTQTLEAEREELPAKAYRAGLDEEYEREDDLKERYREAGQELATAEARIPEVEAELQKLSPQQGDRDELVQIHQYANVNRVASAPLVELKRIASEIQDAATSEAGFFEQVLTDRQGESWSWRQNVSWSEEARDALRKAGSVPGEDRTQVIRKDPEKLAERGRERR